MEDWRLSKKCRKEACEVIQREHLRYVCLWHITDIDADVLLPRTRGLLAAKRTSASVAPTSHNDPKRTFEKVRRVPRQPCAATSLSSASSIMAMRGSGCFIPRAVDRAGSARGTSQPGHDPVRTIDQTRPISMLATARVTGSKAI